MKRYKPAFKQVIKEDAEEDKSIKAIKDLIDMDWEKDEDAQHTALALIKGLVLADTKSADKFLTDLSTYTSKMSIEDYSGKQEEGCKKKPKKKNDLKEMFSITNEVAAQQAITDGFSFLANRYGINHPKLFQKIGFALSVGASEVLQDSDLDDIQKSKLKLKAFIKIFQNIKERI